MRNVASKQSILYSLFIVKIENLDLDSDLSIKNLPLVFDFEENEQQVQALLSVKPIFVPLISKNF